MPTLDLSSYEPVADTDVDAVQIANGFSQIQTTVNALDNDNFDAAAGLAVTKLADPGVGKVVGHGSGAAAAVYPPGYEFDYAQITSDVTVSGTSGAQTTVITGGTVTYDGTTTVDLEVSLAGIANGSADNVTLELWDGATSVGILGQVSTGGAASIIQVPVRHGKRFTPSAGTHMYTLKAYRGTTNGTIKAGTGAAGAVLPSFMRAVKV